MDLENCSVVIHCDKEMRPAVVAQLRQIPGIDEIQELDDEQEILVKVIADSKDHLQRIITWKIQKMACVQSIRHLDSNIHK